MLNRSRQLADGQLIELDFPAGAVDVDPDEIAVSPLHPCSTWARTHSLVVVRAPTRATGAENIGWLQRNMMRIGLGYILGYIWGYMMKKLIPNKVLGNLTGGPFTPRAILLEERAYKCQTVPEKNVR